MNRWRKRSIFLVVFFLSLQIFSYRDSICKFFLGKYIHFYYGCDAIFDYKSVGFQKGIFCFEKAKFTHGNLSICVDKLLVGQSNKKYNLSFVMDGVVCEVGKGVLGSLGSLKTTLGYISSFDLNIVNACFKVNREILPFSLLVSEETKSIKIGKGYKALKLTWDFLEEKVLFNVNMKESSLSFLNLIFGVDVGGNGTGTIRFVLDNSKITEYLGSIVLTDLSYKEENSRLFLESLHSEFKYDKVKAHVKGGNVTELVSGFEINNIVGSFSRSSQEEFTLKGSGLLKTGGNFFVDITASPNNLTSIMDFDQSKLKLDVVDNSVEAKCSNWNKYTISTVKNLFDRWLVLDKEFLPIWDSFGGCTRFSGDLYFDLVGGIPSNIEVKNVLCSNFSIKKDSLEVLLADFEGAGSLKEKWYWSGKGSNGTVYFFREGFGEYYLSNFDIDFVLVGDLLEKCNASFLYKELKLQGTLEGSYENCLVSLQIMGTGSAFKDYFNGILSLPIDTDRTFVVNLTSSVVNNLFKTTGYINSGSEPINFDFHTFLKGSLWESIECAKGNISCDNLNIDFLHLPEQDLCGILSVSGIFKDKSLFLSAKGEGLSLSCKDCCLQVDNTFAVECTLDKGTSGKLYFESGSLFWKNLLLNNCRGLFVLENGLQSLELSGSCLGVEITSKGSFKKDRVLLQLEQFKGPIRGVLDILGYFGTEYNCTMEGQIEGRGFVDIDFCGNVTGHSLEATVHSPCHQISSFLKIRDVEFKCNSSSDSGLTLYDFKSSLFGDTNLSGKIELSKGGSYFDLLLQRKNVELGRFVGEIVNNMPIFETEKTWLLGCFLDNFYELGETQLVVPIESLIDLVESVNPIGLFKEKLSGDLLLTVVYKEDILSLVVEGEPLIFGNRQKILSDFTFSKTGLFGGKLCLGDLLMTVKGNLLGGAVEIERFSVKNDWFNCNLFGEYGLLLGILNLQGDVEIKNSFGFSERLPYLDSLVGKIYLTYHSVENISRVEGDFDLQALGKVYRIVLRESIFSQQKGVGKASLVVTNKLIGPLIVDYNVLWSESIGWKVQGNLVLEDALLKNIEFVYNGDSLQLICSSCLFPEYLLVNLTVKNGRFVVNLVSNGICTVEGNIRTMVIDRIEGNLFGASFNFFTKEYNKDQVVLSGRLSVEKFSFYKDFFDNIGIDGGYTFVGDLVVMVDFEKSYLQGDLIGDNFVFFDTSFRTMFCNIYMDYKTISVSNLKVVDEGISISVPEMKLVDGILSAKELFVKNLRPSVVRKTRLKPLCIDLNCYNLHGKLSDLSTFVGSGSISFVNSFYKESNILELPFEILGKLGLDTLLFVPVKGDVDFTLCDGKIIFSKLRNCYSKNKHSYFYLWNKSESYADFHGNLHIDIKMKQYVLFKFTEFFVLSIYGNVNKPSVYFK